MNWKEFFKPTKLTWIIFSIIVLILVLNVIILNIFDFGIEILVMIPFYSPYIVFESLGLNLGSAGGSGWGWPLPNLLGYIVIIISNIIVIFFVSLLISKLANKIKNSFNNS